MAAPLLTLSVLERAWANRWQFWVIELFWCLLAWAFAGVMYWRVLRTFDRRLGRMRETSQGDPAAVSPRLVAVVALCQNAREQ